MRGVSRLLALALYTAVTLGGAGVHLLEYTPEDGCSGCEAPLHGPSLFAPCDQGPCHAPSHSHHSHPVHHNEDGCVTCSALASQHSETPTALAIAQSETTAASPSSFSVPTPPAVHRPPDRAPPGA